MADTLFGGGLSILMAAVLIWHFSNYRPGGPVERWAAAEQTRKANRKSNPGRSPRKSGI
jgi:hypothetical protein